jgi:1-acyl-sn-glycerol-3-phosphate acyltransferase
MTGNRRIVRRLARRLLRALLPLVAKVEVRGLENCPPGGPLIVALNHLAHLDPPLVMATLPYELEAVALADLYQVPVTGQLLRLYGTIPVRRDEFDREVIRRSLEVLAEGRVLALAPEARMSVTGALEKARDGAAWLAVRSHAPILPVAITGTEKAYTAWRQRRRPRLSVTVGPVYVPPEIEGVGATRRGQLARITDEVMRRIAAMLPPEYRGVYAE